MHIATFACADAPLTPPQTYRACDAKITTCAEVVPNDKTYVYKLSDKFTPALAYTINGWYRHIEIGPGGEFIVSFTQGGLLAWWEHAPSTEAFRFWRRGELWMTVNLGQLHDTLPLPKTSASHSAFARSATFLNTTWFVVRTTNSSCVDVDLSKQQISRRTC